MSKYPAVIERKRMAESLTVIEKIEFEQLEETIQNGLRTFYEVGFALTKIRNNRYYRATHRTFEQYCQGRWGFKKAHAYRLIASSEVRQNLSPIGDISVSESVLRPLVHLPPEKQREVYEEAVKAAPDGKVTAKHIEALVWKLPLDMANQKYSQKVVAPIYEPKNNKPHILELCDKTKALKLMKEIDASDLSNEDKSFLMDAASRHYVFNYEKIADYYAHSSAEMQDLMEKSGLVIIDFNKAIEYGFVRLCKQIRKQYCQDYGVQDEE